MNGAARLTGAVRLVASLIPWERCRQVPSVWLCWTRLICIQNSADDGDCWHSDGSALDLVLYIIRMSVALLC